MLMLVRPPAAISPAAVLEIAPTCEAETAFPTAAYAAAADAARKKMRMRIDRRFVKTVLPGMMEWKEERK